MIPPLQGGYCSGISSSSDAMDALTSFEFIPAFVCTYADPAGLLIVGMLVYGGVSLSIYIRTGSVMIPSVLLLLTGGVVMSQVAAPVVGAATVLLLSAGAGVITLVYYHYSR